MEKPKESDPFDERKIGRIHTGHLHVACLLVGSGYMASDLPCPATVCNPSLNLLVLSREWTQALVP